MKVRIYPNTPELERLLKLYPPVPANKLLPEWYKKMKLHFTDYGEAMDSPTAKKCPAIQDVVNEGFVLPMWGKMFFTTRNLKEGGQEQRWWVQNAHTHKDLDHWMQQHHPLQLKGMNMTKLVDGSILKIKYPFRMIPPKGYGFMYHDPFYHFRQDIRCLTGLVKSDEWGFITFPFEILKDKFEIEAGTPLVHVYLYKLHDEKLELDIGPGTEQEYEDAALVFEQDTLEHVNYKTRKHPYVRSDE